MKKLILSILFITCLQLVKAETPVLTIEYKYSNAVDTVHFQKMKLDNEFCCNFVVISTPGDTTTQDMTILKHTQTGVTLGIIYGKPTKEFILQICKQYNYLDREYVDNLALLMTKQKN